jgi:hypothetical protein
MDQTSIAASFSVQDLPVRTTRDLICSSVANFSADISVGFANHK